MTQSPLDTLDLAVDLPALIQSLDKLTPHLLPYEHAIYWYLFQKSVVKQFDVNGKVSIEQISMTTPFKKLKSKKKKQEILDIIEKALQGLEQKDAVRRTDKIETRVFEYRIFLPSEIKLCQDNKN